MSTNEGGDRLYETNEIVLTMLIAAASIVIPVIMGAIYYLGWL